MINKIVYAKHSKGTIANGASVIMYAEETETTFRYVLEFKHTKNFIRQHYARVDDRSRCDTARIASVLIELIERGDDTLYGKTINEILQRKRIQSYEITRFDTNEEQRSGSSRESRRTE